MNQKLIIYFIDIIKTHNHPETEVALDFHVMRCDIGRVLNSC